MAQLQAVTDPGQDGAGHRADELGPNRQPVSISTSAPRRPPCSERGPTTRRRFTNYLNKSAGPKAADVQTALANIDSARVAVDAAHARLAQTIAGPLPTDINQQQEAVNQLELALKSAQNDLDNAFIRAPFTGTVVTVGVNEGDQVTAASSIATLLDPGLIKVDATLDEANVARVRPGLPALLTFDAIPGRTFAARWRW
ncbi:MAG: HlyD family efflux transporter periplasmic adaptor subunit [Dehalococcoidia bacterium]